jgi:hypothetical protein
MELRTSIGDHVPKYLFQRSTIRGRCKTSAREPATATVEGGTVYPAAGPLLPALELYPVGLLGVGRRPSSSSPCSASA